MNVPECNRNCILSKFYRPLTEHMFPYFVVGDGSCSCIRPFETAKLVSMELSGPDCDPVYDIAQNEKYVFTACRDGHIRKYRMDLNN